MPPLRGEIWWVSLDPIQGHEQAGRRPAVVVSTNQFNTGPSGLVMVLPMTRTDGGLLFHVVIEPFESGLKERGYIMCDQLRTVSHDRFASANPAYVARAVGVVPDHILNAIDDRLRVLLEL